MDQIKIMVKSHDTLRISNSMRNISQCAGIMMKISRITRLFSNHIWFHAKFFYPATFLSRDFPRNGGFAV